MKLVVNDQLHIKSFLDGTLLTHRGQPAPRKQKEMGINTLLQFICCWRKLFFHVGLCRFQELQKFNERTGLSQVWSPVFKLPVSWACRRKLDSSHSPIQPTADHWPHTHRAGKSKVALFCVKSGNSCAMWWHQRSHSLKNLYNWSRKVNQSSVNHHQVRGNECCKVNMATAALEILTMEQTHVPRYFQQPQLGHH